LVVGLAIGLLAGAGFAFTQVSDSGGDQAQKASPRYLDPLDQLPPSATEPAATGAEAERIWKELEQGGPETHNLVTEGVPAEWIVEGCRSSDPPMDPLGCEAVIAIAEGELAPGAYSDDELRARLGE
jgi:hypothetical protein